MSESMNFETLRQLAFGSVSGTYALVGTPANPAVRALIVNNYTNALLIFSLNGTVDHFALDAGASLTLDICANKTQKGFYMAAGKSIYVRSDGVAPTSGSVFFSTMYGEIRSQV